MSHIKNMRVCKKLIILTIVSILFSLFFIPYRALAEMIWLSSPVGGETWVVGTTHKITWSGLPSSTTKVDLQLSTDSGFTWTPIVSGLDPEDGEYSWTVPNKPTTKASIKFLAYYPNNIYQHMTGDLTILAGPPTAPGHLTASTVTSNKVVLNWEDAAGEELYYIFISSNGVTVSELMLGPDVNTHEIENLLPNTTYKIGVTASNSFGGNGSNITVTTKASPPPPQAPQNVYVEGTPPAAPGNLTATVISTSQINVSWDDVAGESGYKIERKSGGSFVQIASTADFIHAYEDDNLSSNTTYTYRIKAYNAYGSNYSSEVAAKTNSTGTPPPQAPQNVQVDGAPNAPANLSASASSSSAIELTWEDKSNDETGFKIERKSSGAFEEIATADKDREVFKDTHLTAGTSYTYRVKAYNTKGSSSYSNEAAAQTNSGSGIPGQTTSNTTQLRFYVGNTDYYVGDELKSMDAPPQIIESRTVLPIRYVAEPLGASVDWNAVGQKITVKMGGKKIELAIGSGRAFVNGQAKAIDPSNRDVKPVIVPPGRTMLPLRFIAEELGCKVDWNPSTKEIKIIYPDPS